MVVVETTILPLLFSAILHVNRYHYKARIALLKHPNSRVLEQRLEKSKQIRMSIYMKELYDGYGELATQLEVNPFKREYVPIK